MFHYYYSCPSHHFTCSYLLKSVCSLAWGLCGVTHSPHAFFLYQYQFMCGRRCMCGFCACTLFTHLASGHLSLLQNNGHSHPAYLTKAALIQQSKELSQTKIRPSLVSSK